MGMIQSNTVYKETVSVFSYDKETPLTGLASSAFSFSFLLNSSTYSSSVTTDVTEIGTTGRYEVSITFPSVGFWATFIDVTFNSEIIETHQINTHVEDVSGDSVYSSSLPGSVAMTQTIGGLPSGTTVSSLSDGTKTVSQVLDTLLFPTAYPTYTQPSCSLTDNVANLQIAGASINITLNTTANRGTINTSWDPGSQGAFAGAVTAARYSHNSVNTDINVGPGSTDIDNVQINGHTVALGSNSWTLTVTFAAGLDPLDSAGNIVAGAAFAGGSKSNSTSFEGVFPIKLGTDSGGFTDRSLVSHNANNIQCSQNYNETAAIRHRIKISNAMINSRTVTFQQWNPVSSSYSDLASSEFSSSSVTENVQGGSVGYTLFTKAGSTGGGDVDGQPLYRVRFG